MRSRSLYRLYRKIDGQMDRLDGKIHRQVLNMWKHQRQGQQFRICWATKVLGLSEQATMFCFHVKKKEREYD